MIKLVLCSLAFVFIFGIQTTNAYAALNNSSLDTETSVGSIETFANVFVFIFNLLAYLGWAGVIIGIGYTIFVLIYNLITDDVDAKEAVRSRLMQAVIITMTGILLLSAGYIVKVLSATIGENTAFELEEGEGQ